MNRLVKLIAGSMLLLTCATSPAKEVNRYQWVTKDYHPWYNMKHKRVEGKIATTEERMPRLIKRGYALIGRLKLRQYTEKCFPAGYIKPKIKCRTKEHKRKIIDEVTRFSQENGGDLIRILSGPTNYKGGVSLQYCSNIKNTVTHTRYGYSTTQTQCLQYKTLKGRGAYREINVELYRKNPLLVKHHHDSKKFVDALLKGRTKTALMVVNNGLLVNERLTILRHYPVSMAAKQGNAEIVKLLLDKGAAVKNYRSSAENPLNLAVKNGHLAAAKVLVENGAVINYKMFETLRVDNKYYKTPLHAGIKYPKIVKYLVSKGANLNKKNYRRITPIGMAVEKQAPESVRILAEAGAKLDVRQGKKRLLREYPTALDRATEFVYRAKTKKEKQTAKSIVAILEKAGAKNNKKYSIYNPNKKYVPKIKSGPGYMTRIMVYHDSYFQFKYWVRKNKKRKDNRYFTYWAYRNSIEGGKKKWADYLHKEGMDVNAKPTSVKRTVAEEFIIQGKVKELHLVLHYPVDKNILKRAARNERRKLAKGIYKGQRKVRAKKILEMVQKKIS